MRPPYSTVALLAGLLGSLSITAGEVCAQSSRGSVNARDYWHLQQVRAGAQSNYSRYAKPQSSGAYSQYGSQAKAVERIDKAFETSSKHMSEFDYYELTGRIHALKQDIASGVSRGTDDGSYDRSIQLLEEDLNKRANDSMGYKRKAEEDVFQAMEKLEQTFSAHKESLGDLDRRYIQEKIDGLKSRKPPDSHSDVASAAAEFQREAQHLEHSILSRSQEPTILQGTVTRSDEAKEEPAKGLLAAPDMESDQKKPGPFQSLDESPSSPIYSRPVRPVPLLPLPRVFENMENRLLNLKEAGRLGTFDMDRYSERLLRVKHMQQKMMSRNGRLSHYQDGLLRDELKLIGNDMESQVDAR